MSKTVRKALIMEVRVLDNGGYQVIVSTEWKMRQGAEPCAVKLETAESPY